MNKWGVRICVFVGFAVVNFTDILGEPSKSKSEQKCNEYNNITKEFLEELERNNSHPSGDASESEYIFAGGEDAEVKELPFMAALGYQDGDMKIYLCGGSLISEKFVLTAAHCIFSSSWGKVRYVRLGDLNLTSLTDDVNVQEFEIKTYHVHPEYKFPQRYHDIALIELDGRVILSDYVTPICLDEGSVEFLAYETFYAAGWGITGYGENPSEHLQVGLLQHYSIDECQATFGRDSRLPEGLIADYQVCAGAIDHIADTCEGDSGGPLAYERIYPKKIYYLAGITSFGKACALAKIPAVYTRISYYVRWIEKIVWPENNLEKRDGRIIFPDD